MRLTYLGRSAVIALGLVLALGACQTGNRQAATTQAPAAPPPAAPVAPAEPELAVQTRPELAGKTLAALLVPLSGPQAALGQQLNNAAQLALFDLAGDNFALIVEDTGGTPQGAAAAAERALTGGAQIILGPLFSGSVNGAAPAAGRLGVNVVAFSSDTSVTRPGVWTLGLSPEEQIERVIGYASRQGLYGYSILAPRTAYGDLVSRAAQEAVRANGGQVVNVITYTPGGTNYSGEVQSLAAAPGDAVILPAGGRELLTIAPLMPYYDIDPEVTQYIGTALWNDPSLGAEPALTGGWFSAPPPAAWEGFAARYRQLYGQEPRRLASLAYDAVALAAVLGRQGLPGANPYDSMALTNASGFQGIDGLFRFMADGSTERGLAVLELQNGRIDVIEIAPEAFGYTGS